MEADASRIREQLADGSIFRTDAKRAQELSESLSSLEAEIEKAVDRWAELEEAANAIANHQ